jgi:hypothetical protein
MQATPANTLADTLNMQGAVCTPEKKDSGDQCAKPATSSAAAS